MPSSLDVLHAAVLAVAILAAAVTFAQEVETAGEIATEAAGADIVIVGEVHDNPGHHRLQADLVDRIAPSAVVFEMLTPAQAGVARESAAEGAELGAALGWEDAGWPDFAMYAPIFAAADAAGARVYGAAVPRDRVAEAMQTGLPAAFRGDAARYGLDANLDPAEQEVREAGQMAAHCDALPEDMLPAMVSAQRLKDAAFARTTLQALRDTGGPVVVVTGNGHARTDWGIPRYIARAAPEARVVSLGQIEGSPSGADAPPFDVWRVTETIARPDPCAAFREG